MNLIDIFKNNPVRLQLAEARKQSERLALHITGLNMSSAIETMEEFETEQKKNLRQKYSRSNRDIFARLHRPIDKVFSAKGGSTIINLSDSQLKQFKAFSNNIRKGMSLRKWVEQVALKAFQIDPNGLIFIEVDQNGKPYPTYKSTKDIFYYETTGRNVNLVIFTVSPAEAKQYALQSSESSAILERMGKTKLESSKYYRVVDDVSDKIVEWDGKSITEIPELNLPNPFMRCPGFIVSNIYQFNSELLLSPDSDVVELANSLLTQSSVFEIWKNLHMFPKHWRMQSVCPTCQGNKEVAGKECSDCHGTGFQKRSSVRDEIIVPFPESSDGKISMPTEFDGYSYPGIEPWELATNDLDRLFNQMFQTMWDYAPNQPHLKDTGSTEKSATQVLDESHGKVQRLKSFSEWAESIETFIVDICAGLMFGASYHGCSICYGDRYIMEGPDVIWEKYSNARTKGGSQAILDNLLRDYYESRYSGSPLELRKAMNQMAVEPFVHLTAQQVESLGITDIDKASKVYFSEWASLKTDMDWIMTNPEVLRIELIEYATVKLQLIRQDVKDAAAEAQLTPALPKMA